MAVDVIGPVIVAVHVNVNGPVSVIDTGAPDNASLILTCDA